MASASYQQTNFLGGEYSKAAQGRSDLPTYRTAMNVCLNTIPIESGAALRRPGSRHCTSTRGGLAANVIAFDFKEPFPYVMLVSDGVIRFLSEINPVTTNDDATISAISAANPAVVTTAAAHGWATSNQTRAASNVTQLMNRDLAITVLSPTTFSIADAITGAGIDGATLDAFVSGTVARIAEIVTPFTGASWQSVRSIQAETTAMLVNGTLPQILTVEQAPTDTAFAEFALAPASFLDGPYLDPVPGSYITASALNGVVTLTLSFQPWSSGVAYNIGDYVTYSGQGYRSTPFPNNQGFVPSTSPDRWAPVNAGDPYNGGAGIISADAGRLIRLFSEPPLWDSGATYAAPQIVAYAASGETVGYYQATGSIGSGVKPGTSTSWAVVAGASVAIWTWGRILSVSASGITAPDSTFGNLTGGGGVASAFDGNASKSFASSANFSAATATAPAWSAFPWPINSIVQYGGTIFQFVNFTGMNFYYPPPLLPGNWQVIGTVSNITFDTLAAGHLPAPTQIASVTVTPPVDTGFTNSPQGTFTLNLRAKATAPASADDGTLLGSTGTASNTTSPISITSNDQTTAWNYVWVELISTYTQPLPDNGSHSFIAKVGIAQVVFFAPNIANGSVISVQIAGDALLYTNACRKWRLGVYGGNNGYPTCGTYTDGRIWLSGVVGNRVDSSKSNVIRNGALVLDFAPTTPAGIVADDNAIATIFAGPDVNQVFWLEPDQQGIICGTQAGEWLIAPTAPGGLTPLTTGARRVTKIGCANVLPRRTDHTLVFVQKFKRKIQEYFADVYSGKFSSPHLTKNAKHLTVASLEDVAYQQELVPTVWGRLANGGLIGVTYQRDSLTTSRGPDIAGAHRHQLGSARAVRSFCVAGSSDGNLDSLYMITEEAAGGGFHAEILTNLLDEGFSFSDVWMLDNGIVPSSFAIEAASGGAPYGGVRLYGLWPHNGKTVAAYLIGLDCGSTTDANGNPIIQDFTVSNGSIFVPFGDGVSAGSGDGLFTQALVTPFVGASVLPMVVGFPYVSDGQCVRPATPQESGSRIGPALGERRRTHQMAAQLYGCVTRTIEFGTSFDRLLPAVLTTEDGTELTRQQLFDGVHRMSIEAVSDFDNMLCWRISRPHPAFVVSLAGFLKTQEI